MSQSVAVPTHTALLRGFVNTRDVETGGDELGSARSLTRWLRDRELVAPGTAEATPAEHRQALRLRETLRAAMTGHHDTDGADHAALETACADHPVRVSFRTGSPALDPVADGVSGGLARIAAAIMASGADGTWPRLKVCPEDTCQWAFVDTSKNRSRTWCAMRMCGNRSKTRAYRARQRSGADSG